MRRPVEWLGLALAIALMAGCSSPEPPAVFVDLNQLERVLATPSPATPAVTAGNSVSSARLPDSAPFRLFTGITQKELAESFRQVRNNQDAAVKKILEQRLKVLDAEIESALASSRSRLEPSHTRLLEDAVAQTRIPFDRVAPRVGMLTLELTNLIGFPDLGQDYRRVDAPWSQARAKRVEEIRIELQTLNAQYLKERNAILDQAYKRIERDFATLDSNAALARQEGEARLIAGLRKLVADSGTVPTRPSTGQTDFTVPGSSGASVSIRSDSSSLPPLAATPTRRTEPWVAEQKAKIWSAAHGYRLVSSKREGRDATQECITWIQTQTAGH